MSARQIPPSADVVIVGAGHNGLVSAILLARAGLSVVVLEANGTIGGATRTERPFPKVPELGQSTGSYLLGLMPPELLRTLDLTIPVLRRDPHYFLPTPGPGAYLLFGSDRAATREQLQRSFSAQDVAADDAMQAEIAALRADLAPAWLGEPRSVEETAEVFVRPALRRAFIDLVRGSVADYLARFDFRSELLLSMYAVTDGLSGVNAGPDDPGTGHNFLVHNMCRLPGSDGTWMIAAGGMGTVSGTFAQAAVSAGAQILGGVPVAEVFTDAGAVAPGTIVEAPQGITTTTPCRPPAVGPPDRHHPEGQPRTVRPAALHLPPGAGAEPVRLHDPPAARLRLGRPDGRAAGDVGPGAAG